MEHNSNAPLTNTPLQRNSNRCHTERRTPTTIWAPTPEALFLKRVSLLRHVPSKTRKDLAEALAVEWWSFKRATTEAAQETYLLRALALPTCILMVRAKTPNDHSIREQQSTRQLIRARLTQWRAGNIAPLWNAVIGRARRTRAPRSAQTPQREHNLRRARALAQEQAYAKAMRALDSVGTHEATPSVQQEIVDKHPQQTPHTDGLHELPPQSELPQIPQLTPFTREEVMRCAKKFPRGSAAGGSGFSPGHLLELLQAPDADNRGGLQDAIAAGAAVLAKGRGPERLARWLAGAPITALRKPDGGVRPIAVGETIRRLVSSLLMSRIATKARDMLDPAQIGVAVPGGCEAAIHSVREIAHRYRNDNRFGLLQVDLKNAFNLVSRAAFRQQVRTRFPEIYHWTEYCYGPRVQPELWVQNYRIRSVCGVQQGDPLGPLLFSLALQPVLERLRYNIGIWRNELGLPTRQKADKNEPSLCVFYLDDGLLIDHHEILRKAVEFLNSHPVRQYGLHLRVEKCNIWWPTQPTEQHASKYPPNLQRIKTEGHEVLKSPIGTHRFLTENVDQRIMALLPKFSDILDLEDAQVSLMLLRSCLGICQVNYLIRTVPSAATMRGMARYDRMVYAAVNALVGGTLPAHTFQELQLPVRPLGNNTHTLGLGLTSAVKCAPAAYLSSLTQTRALTNDMVSGTTPWKLPEHWHAINAHRMLINTSTPTDAPALSELEATTEPPTQRKLTEMIHKRTWERLPRGDTRTQAFRATMQLPGSKDWINAPPSPSLGTYVPNRDFRAWLKFYCRIPIRNKGDATCPHPKCTKSLDLYGDHLLVCSHAPIVGKASRTVRHDRQVRLLAEDLSKAARSPVIEPKQRDGDHSRPDIRSIGHSGGDDIIDVSITHPFLTPITCTRTISRPETLLNVAFNKKVTKHTPLLREQTGGRVIPIIFSVAGGWEKRSYEYAKNLARETSARADINSAFYTRLFFQRHSIRLIASNAKALLHELTD